MLDAHKTRPQLPLVSLLILPLWLCVHGCGESDDGTPDGGAEPARDGGERGDASPGSADSGDGKPSEPCQMSDCEGMPIPEIGCAQGEPIIVCERRADGSCGVGVVCSGGTCGGFAGEACSEGEFCNVEPELGGDGCTEIADGQGLCQAVPKVCPDIYAPVCGCDLRSHSNDCEAHAQGTSVRHTGLCTADECVAAGGRPEASDGASIPMCEADEVSYEIPGIEPALCCLPPGS